MRRLTRKERKVSYIPINIAFEPLYYSDKRYYLITGGRGSLKSTSVHDFIVRLTYERGHGILFTRYTLKSASMSIIPEFKKTLSRLALESDFHVTNTIAINKRTGSFIYFSGIKTSSGDQTANLKSIAGITTWVIEEGEDFKDRKTFNDIDNSIRSTEAQNRVIWIQNPTTRQHFIYEDWIEKTNKQIKVEGFEVTVSDHPDVEHIHTTYRIAESLGYLERSWLEKANNTLQDMKDQINQLKKSWDKSLEELNLEIRNIAHSSSYYYTYIGGWLEKAEGVIFTNWIEGDFDDTLPYCFGLDYGYSPDPLAMGKIAVDKKRKRIYVKEIAYAYEIDDVPGFLDGIKEIRKRDLIVCDTNEPRTTANIKKAGFNIQKTVKKPGQIAEDIREIKTFLIIVHPGSKNFKIEFNNYAWNDLKASIPIDKFNHLCDQMRYGYKRLVKKKKSGARRVN